MKILFYVEPLIELEKPYWKEGWASSWCRKMIQCLGRRHDYFLAVNDGVAEKFGLEPGVKIVIFSQEELLKVFPQGYTQASSAWYLRNYNDEQMNYYISLMKTKFSNIHFDLIITFTQVPFLEMIYPSARVLHMEYSIFSRIPFPETWYLDPCGLYENNYLSTYKESIKGIQLTAQQKNLIDELKAACIDAFLENNIFVDEVKKLRGKYKYLLLLPVQFSGYYGFDCLSRYTSQYDYLTRTLEKIPMNIGVIFTMHPEYPIFDEETVSYITTRYKNAIFLEYSRNIYAASQWLMPLIDGVVTVSSSIGIQSLLFGKKLIALGNMNLDYIADTHELGHEISAILSEEQKDKDNVLWFMITKYTIPSEYLFDGDWLDSFLKRCVSRFVDKDFFEEVDDPQKVIHRYMDTIKNNKSMIPQWVMSNHGRCEAARGYCFLNGRYEESGVVWPQISFKENIYSVRFHLKGIKTTGRFRFDPLEGKFCVFTLLHFKTDVAGCVFKAINADNICGREFTFYSTDPMLEIVGDFSIATYLDIQYKIDLLPIEKIELYYKQLELHYKNRIDGLEADNHSLHKEIHSLNKEIADIKSTKGYRMLEQFRHFRDMIKPSNPASRQNP